MMINDVSRICVLTNLALLEAECLCPHKHHRYFTGINTLYQLYSIPYFVD